MKAFKNLRNIGLILLLTGSIAACTQDDEVGDTDFVDTDGPEVNMSGRDGKMVNMEDWDTDRNQEINEMEFQPGIDGQNAFTNWDANKNNNLERIEFEDNVYRDIDRNRDQNIDREEFDAYSSSWYNNEQGNFEDWDTDKNDMISKQEFQARMTSSNNLFINWDKNKDNIIDQDEFRKGMFSRFDRDNNGRLNQEEFSELQQMLMQNQ